MLVAHSNGSAHLTYKNAAYVGGGAFYAEKRNEILAVRRGSPPDALIFTEKSSCIAIHWPIEASRWQAMYRSMSTRK